MDNEPKLILKKSDFSYNVLAVVIVKGLVRID